LTWVSRHLISSFIDVNNQALSGTTRNFFHINMVEVAGLSDRICMRIDPRILSYRAFSR